MVRAWHQPSLGILPLLIELAASSAVITSLAIGLRSSTSVVACHNNSHHSTSSSSDHHHSTTKHHHDNLRGEPARKVEQKLELEGERDVLKETLCGRAEGIAEIARNHRRDRAEIAPGPSL